MNLIEKLLIFILKKRGKARYLFYNILKNLVFILFYLFILSPRQDQYLFELPKISANFNKINNAELQSIVLVSKTD